MLIYTVQSSPRLQYIANNLFGADVIITSDAFVLQEYASLKINYSNNRISNDELWITPHELLFQNNIIKQNIIVDEWLGLKIFFKTAGDIPFDFLSAAFYLLSRYEEYLPHTKDEYGRYSHKESLAFKNAFLQQPLINLWLHEIKDQFPNFSIHDSKFIFIPTYDIDIAYAYKGHGFLRNEARLAKLIITNKKAFSEAFKIIYKNKKDTFDIYTWLDELHETYDLEPRYFFLLAKRRSVYDKNVKLSSKIFQQLIRSIAAKYKTGIHPSWQSYFDDRLLKQEITSLQKISGNKTYSSRQHYIKFTLPQTYRSLITAGITEDYSMGYGSINGFRASYCKPFFWYDVMNEQTTNLLLYPFCYMEANSHFEQHYTVEQATKELQQYHDVVKKVNGVLITIFHNHFLTQQPQWQAWRALYQQFLENNFKLINK